MVRVAVMGCGTVGSGVIKMLDEHKQRLSRATGDEITLVYALDIRPVDVPLGAKWTDKIDDLLVPGAVDIAVETIGGAGVAYAFTRALLEKGISVVSSNKELVVKRGAELTDLARAHGAHYLYEAAVGGGVPIIRPIKRDLGGNNLTGICGIVNGSTNYLLTRMAEGHVDFPAALAEAKELGYVEANPAADVDGIDACRKLAILANTAFGASFEDADTIPTEGIGTITERDMACAAACGGAIRLIARAERADGAWSGWVHPALVLETHPLCRVGDVFNGIVVTGDCVGDVMFYGRGAGSLPTASAVVGDIIEIARGMKPDQADQAAPAFASPDGALARLMLRAEADDESALIAAVDECIPGASVVRVKGGLFAVMTAEGIYRELLSGIDALKAAGYSCGTALRVIQ